MQQRSFPPYHPPAPSHHILAPALLLLLLCHQLHQALPSLPFTLPLPPALSQASSTDPFFLRPSHTRFNHSLPNTVSTVDPLILVRVLNRFTSSWCQSFDSSPTLRKSLSISDRIHRDNISQGQNDNAVWALRQQGNGVEQKQQEHRRYPLWQASCFGIGCETFDRREIRSSHSLILLRTHLAMLGSHIIFD